MVKQEITDIQRKMEAAFRHEVKVYIAGKSKPFIGKCVGFTPPLDNEPEKASIDIDTGMRFSVTELFEDEIESITILD